MWSTELIPSGCGIRIQPPGDRICLLSYKNCMFSLVCSNGRAPLQPLQNPTIATWEILLRRPVTPRDSLLLAPRRSRRLRLLALSLVHTAPTDLAQPLPPPSDPSVTAMGKRKRPDSKVPALSMTEQEKIVYNLIQSKQDLGIWSRDMKRETSLPNNVVDKSLKSLCSKGLIKEVVTVWSKSRKHFLASEFEPSSEITGGKWYDQGTLDTEFINFLKDQCLKHIRNMKIATVDMVANAVRRSRVLKNDCSSQEIGEIVRALILDNDVIEMRSNGLGEFASVPTGRMCYKCRRSPDATTEPRVGAMASIPCGVCPQIANCAPGGVISPTTCEYYSMWLDF